MVNFLIATVLFSCMLQFSYKLTWSPHLKSPTSDCDNKGSNITHNDQQVVIRKKNGMIFSQVNMAKRIIPC